MKQSCKNFLPVFLLGGALLAACTSPTTPPTAAASLEPTATLTLTLSPTASLTPSITPSPSETPKPTHTRIPTLSPQPTHTPTITNTPTPTADFPLALAESTPHQISTPIETNAATIGLENYTALANVAQWGKGSLLSVAFAPDGKTFVAGSAYGLAVFDRSQPDQPSSWLPFDTPFYYDSLIFSQDGSYILLENRKSSQFRHYPDMILIQNADNIIWQRNSVISYEWGHVQLDSPSGKLKLKSYVTHDENFWDIEFSNREIYDSKTGDILFRFSDGTIQVYYSDYSNREGCDLASFSYCGNAYSPSANLPYQVGYAPNEHSLAILYRPPNLWPSDQFGILRLYDLQNGSLIQSFGSFDDPIAAFAYAPDGKTLVYGDLKGAVHLWDVNKKEVTFDAWPLRPVLNTTAFSKDGKFLIAQRGPILEVHRTSDGGVVSRYEATAFAISPLENLIALGDAAGNIKIHQIDTGQMVRQIAAHEDIIYALAFSPDGTLLASSGQDCASRVWQVATGEFFHSLAENWTDAYYEQNTASRIFIYNLEFLPGTNQIIGSGSWGRVASWNINSGITNFLIEPEPLEYWNGMVTLNPHFPEYFGVNVEQGHFYINEIAYNLADGSYIGPYERPSNTPINCASAGPVTLDGKLRFTIGLGNQDGRICVLDAQDNHLLDTFEVPAGNSISWPYLSPNGNQLIVTTYGGPIYVYQIVSEQSPSH